MNARTFLSAKVLLVIFLVSSCQEPVKNYESKVVSQDPAEAREDAANLEENTPLELAEGLQMSLWATDSLAPDPVAMSVDDFGGIYLTRTNRQKNSEFDIRGHRQWMTPSIALQSVEERRAFLKEVFATEKSEENEWLDDLNGDSIHDWRDLAVEKEEIWKLEDTDNDGLANTSTRILSDFNSEITDVAGALLVRRNDVFVGVGPDMWRVYDKDKNGILDEKESIAHGFAVHIGFGGHGMSGAVEGPDGKIYWGIGDIGANITSVDGKNFKYPNRGVLVRANPDGSNFEVFAAGLRNTHEFDFDKYGNIIGADNDGDHDGESERLVHIVEGSDTGWRTNWQFGKYTDPKNNDYKVWMEEKLYIPRWEGQAAYILPPIKNYHNGPTGFIYNPGTALGQKWTDKFFVVEFVGTPSRSPIWAFSLTPKGASFDLNEDIMVAKGILPTGIRFGPDGALYAADWVNGWGTKNYGRVWKVDVTAEANDLAEERAETQKLIQMDYTQQTVADLTTLLKYGDMRIRKKAQFELTDRSSEGQEALLSSVEQTDNQLARVHGIWGLGMMIESGQADGEVLLPYLNDNDPEIISQTLKVLGDARYSGASDLYVSLLDHENPRVKFFAAQAIGRVGVESAAPALIELLEENNDEDLYLRHAAVLAMARIGAENAAVDLKNHELESMRTAGVLVLRRLESPRVAEYLSDESEYIVTEAARAINDDWSIEAALPALAAVLEDDSYTSEPLIRRSVNAALRVAGEKELDLMLSAAEREDLTDELRAEALLAYSTYASPSVHDRVDGRYRGEITRDPAPAVAKASPKIDAFLSSNSEEVVSATAQVVSRLEIDEYADQLASIAANHGSERVRAGMIEALYDMEYAGFEDVIKIAINDNSETVRSTALSYLDELELTDESLPEYVNPIFEKGSLREQQQVLSAMSDMSGDITIPILDNLADQWISDELNRGISLDLLEAIDASGSDALIAKVDPHRSSGNTTEDFQEVLYGGDRGDGARVFWGNATAQCIRCHSWDNEPGSVGPGLGGVANRLTREQLLESLIEPSARLAPGFGTVNLTLKDGSTVTGILLEESDDELLLKTNEAEPLEIAVSRVDKRQNLPSSMPPMGQILTKREIRDVVEFLSSLK